MIALLIGLGVVIALLLVMVLRRGAAGIGAGGRAPAPAGTTPANTTLAGTTRTGTTPAGTAQPSNVTVTTRYERWMTRVQRERLGAWGEHWADLSRTRQYAAWRQLAEARGAGADVKHYIARSLLSEVIYAAGGVERELGQLRRSLANVWQV